MEKILVFGDSITHGACDLEKGGWVERLKVYFANNSEDKSVYNLGVSGDNTEDLIERFVNECEAREPEIIIFAIGINDSSYIKSKNNPIVPIDKFEKNLNFLIMQAKKFTQKIIFIGLTNIDESKTMPIPRMTIKYYYTKENAKMYNSIIEKVCKNENLKFIPLWNLINKEDLEDGLHPNSKGHKEIFEKVRDFLIKEKITS